MQKIIFLACFVLEITKAAGEGIFTPPPPNHLTSIKKANQNRVNTPSVYKPPPNIHPPHPPKKYVTQLTSRI